MIPARVSVTLDIAAAIGAFVWPLILLIVLFAYRRQLPALATGLLGRISKIGFGGMTIDLATVRPFEPNLTAGNGDLDLRNKAGYMQISDSTARNFMEQLRDSHSADYALIDLGQGREWLSSRLYILTLLFARMKGLQAFVFLEATDSARRQYVGWAEPSKIRWALAERYPHLESAYAAAYSQVMAGDLAPYVLSRSGKFGYQSDPNNQNAAINLFKEFLQRVQAPAPPVTADPSQADEWISLESVDNTHERARWLTAADIEEILGEDLHASYVRRDDLRGKPEADKIRLLATESGHYIAITRENKRFDALLDRELLLEKAANALI